MKSVVTLEKGNVPLYFQLEHVIRSKILIGEFMQGEQIPTERDFCEAYKVSTITVRQAILNLVKEGLLYRKQGKGTFVAEGTSNIDQLKNIKSFNISGDIENIIPDGIGTEKVKVLDMVRVRVPSRVSLLLNLRKTAEVFQISRIRSQQNVSTSLVINYLPLEIGERLRKSDLSQYSMLHLLRDKLGIK